MTAQRHMTHEQLVGLHQAKIITIHYPDRNEYPATPLGALVAGTENTTRFIVHSMSGRTFNATFQHHDNGTTVWTLTEQEN